MERLVTGEAVVLELNPARLPSRMLAFVIDLVLRSFIGFCCVVLLGVIAVITGWDDDEAVGATTVAGVESHGERVRVRLGDPLPAAADVTPAALAELGLVEGRPVWAAVKAVEVRAYPG